MDDHKRHDRQEEKSGNKYALEHALVSLAASGDKDAFETLYRQNSAQVYGLSLRLTADREKAESLVQDTFVKAWFAIGSFRYMERGLRSRI